MANGYGVEDTLGRIQHGIEEMDGVMNDLQSLANHHKSHNPTPLTEADEQNVLSLCKELIRPNSIVSRLLVIQDNCHKAVLGLYNEPKYGPQARYCVEASLHAAEYGSNTAELAEMLKVSIQKLRDRARKQGHGKWDATMEANFSKTYGSRLDSLAKVYVPGPNAPDYAGLIRPCIGPETICISRTLTNYLSNLEEIPKHYRAILDYLDKVCVALSRKYC